VGGWVGGVGGAVDFVIVRPVKFSILSIVCQAYYVPCVDFGAVLSEEPGHRLTVGELELETIIILFFWRVTTV
jgi:hypothetical protein